MIRGEIEAHYRSLWGEPSRRARFSTGAMAVEILKWAAAQTREGVALYATLGASTMTGPRTGHRAEFYMGLSPECDDVAPALADLTVKVDENESDIGHGHTISYPKPLWPGTSMKSLLVMEPPVPIVPTLKLQDGTHVHYLQAVPIHDSELQFKQRHGPEGLLRAWQKIQVPFWDPARRDPELVG
jgi:hypothetical protein